MVVPIFVVGLASAILTEILKLYPALNETKERKRIVAFIVAVVIAGIYAGSQGELISLGGLAFILGVLASSFTIYKSLIQTIQGVIKKSESEAA